MKYRVNYGNGTVSSETTSKRLALRQRAECFAQEKYGAYSFVEFQDPDTGDWFSCGIKD